MPSETQTLHMKIADHQFFHFEVFLTRKRFPKEICSGKVLKDYSVQMRSGATLPCNTQVTSSSLERLETGHYFLPLLDVILETVYSF